MRAAALWDERIGPSRTMAAVTSVMRVQQILLSAVDGALRPHGLTFARYEALVLLSFSRNGRLPMRVMGDRLQLHPTSVTNIVDRLQADGLVRRVPHPTDRRATLVEITDGGRAVLEDATKAVTDVDFGLSGLTPQEETQLTVLLSRIRHAAGDFAAEPDTGSADDPPTLPDPVSTAVSGRGAGGSRGDARARSGRPAGPGPARSGQEGIVGEPAAHRTRRAPRPSLPPAHTPRTSSRPSRTPSDRC